MHSLGLACSACCCVGVGKKCSFGQPGNVVDGGEYQTSLPVVKEVYTLHLYAYVCIFNCLCCCLHTHAHAHTHTHTCTHTHIHIYTYVVVAYQLMNWLPTKSGMFLAEDVEWRKRSPCSLSTLPGHYGATQAYLDRL